MYHRLQPQTVKVTFFKYQAIHLHFNIMNICEILYLQFMKEERTSEEIINGLFIEFM